MSNINNERVIFSDQENKNGYSIQIKDLNRIKDGIKGASICVKQIKNGKVLTGNLFYQWIADREQAKGLFMLMHEVVQENVDSFNDMKWIFHYHPLRFLIKHRN